MKAFQYATAHSTASARQLVAGNGAYLAGGNDLLGLLKDYLVSANILVNIKSLPGLDKIERGEKSWTLGALVTVAQLEHDDEIKKTFAKCEAVKPDSTRKISKEIFLVGISKR